MSGTLTARNQRAIDLYLGGGQAFCGNGTACWQEVNGTKNKATAAANWARMLGKASARDYLERRQHEIDIQLLENLVYEREQALSDILRIKADAMVLGQNGAMKDRQTALKASVEALKVQGKHPDQRSGALGPRVSININTDWKGGMREVEPEPHEFSAQEADHENVAIRDTRKPITEVVIIGKPKYSST